MRSMHCSTHTSRRNHYPQGLKTSLVTKTAMKSILGDESRASSNAYFRQLPLVVP